MKKQTIRIAAVGAAVVVLLAAGTAIGLSSRHSTTKATPDTAVVATEDPMPSSYMIEGVPAKQQDELKAGCETHAVTALLQSYGYDIDEFSFANNYLDVHYVFDDGEGHMYGPDMNSGFAGTAYAGWGIYAPAMAKCMNHYLSDVKSKQKAVAHEGGTLADLCREYIVNGTPVAVWATTDMQEPVPHDTWEVNYVDENAKYKLGDSFTWPLHEHCLVLVGYDEREYYFSDSVAGTTSHFEKALCEKRFEQLGSQYIVLE
ncbi:C39 family peptidase [Ruminococcus difficilis]|uniref:C39 family peptidase n=1 Tax=Ruminococcus difficilis TaxID=2763069 RepID=A0A934WTP8_9FIRM|nr:C39 family peptidase [Ruminococcus difficilis]MBK6089783.1 C39 family peptidase [Ruminococcus difficilis]